MEFCEFVESVREEIWKFCKDEEEPVIQDIQGNNGTVRTGISMKREREAAVVCLNGYYERFQEGHMTAGAAAEEIYDLLHISKSSILPEFMPRNFEEAKKKIVYRLVDYGRNRKLLEDIPYIRYCNLAVTFYLLIEINENGQLATLIRNPHMREWKMDVDTLYSLAKKNTPRLLPPSLVSVADILKSIGREYIGDADKGEPAGSLPEGQTNGLMYILTNRNGIHGAAVILYEGVLKWFAQKRGSDLYILPSSVHEVLLVPCTSQDDAARLREMVREVNRTKVSKEEVLSDHVYLYSRETNQVSLAF